MRKLDSLALHVRQQCIYLMDREGLSDSLIKHVMQTVPLAASGIIGADRAAPDHRGVFCGYPAGFLSVYFNKDHEKHDFYKNTYKVGRKTGLSTNFAKDFKRDYPEDYYERYEPFGLTCGAQTVFFDQAGNLMGVYSWLKNKGFSFSAAEQKTMQEIAPLVFFAFRRYRWLLEEDFFNARGQDPTATGLIATDMKGRVVFSNESAAVRFKLSMDTPAPPRLWGVREETLRRTQSSDTLVFRDISAHLPGVGNVISFRYNSVHGGKYLVDVPEEGWVFFIPTRFADAAGKIQLSKREREVLRLMAGGKTDKEIAEELSLSIKTVQTYTQRLFEKFETSNRTETAARAMKFGVL